MNRDLERVCDYYVGGLIEEIVRERGVCGKELHGIWRAIKRPKKDRSRRVEAPTKRVSHPTLHGLKDEDLRRHCLRSGILPPAHRDDMIRVLCAKLRHP